MDYQTQQFKLLPLLASAYALRMAGKAMMMLFMQVRGQMEEGNLESLPEVGQRHPPPKLLATIIVPFLRIHQDILH